MTAVSAAAVSAEHELLPVENLRELRLALDVIHLFLSPDLDSDAIRTALRDLHERLYAEEDRELQETGVSGRYLIIRPVSLINPPPPEDMERITDAVRTLASLGMIAGRGDSS